MKRKAVITKSEIQNQPGLDIGTIPRILVDAGFRADNGLIIPKLKGTVTSWVDPETGNYHYTQKYGSAR